MADLLSNLPAELHCHILSFLTTKEAALTSSLSKKWRNLFALVPHLVVDDSKFLHPEEGKREREGILQSFMDFVDRVLSLQGTSPIKRFSLKCGNGVCHARVNSWICKVLQRGVSDLDLVINFDDEYYLPRELFVSETLVNLRFRNPFGLDWWTGAKGTFLPMLKSLDVFSLRIFCDDKIQLLLPCFPVLEVFEMGTLDWTGSDDDTVSSANLTKLLVSGDRSRNPKSVSFDTPNLLSLIYSDLVAEDYPLVNLKNLLKARLVLRVSDDQIKRAREPNYDLLDVNFGNVVKLMNGIQNVEQLHLCPDTLEVLSLCCETMPVFNNVKMLAISSKESRGWQALPVLLRNCPHLERLIFEGLVHHVTDKCGDVCDCIYRKDKGRSLKSCPVKVLEIKGFTVTMKEVNMIEQFLDYFPCLKEVKIYIEHDGVAQIINFPEESELIMDMMAEYDEFYTCDVQFYVFKSKKSSTAQ